LPLVVKCDSSLQRYPRRNSAGQTWQRVAATTKFVPMKSMAVKSTQNSICSRGKLDSSYSSCGWGAQRVILASVAAVAKLWLADSKLPARVKFFLQQRFGCYWHLERRCWQVQGRQRLQVLGKLWQFSCLSILGEDRAATPTCRVLRAYRSNGQSGKFAQER